MSSLVRKRPLDKCCQKKAQMDVARGPGLQPRILVSVDRRRRDGHRRTDRADPWRLCSWHATADRAPAGWAGCDSRAVPWALSSQVTLMLLDQNNREHVIDAFRPDVTSSSFQRPVSDMNIASGCPLFCPVSKMEAKNSYVRDDAIFIKAIVDLTGL